MTSEKEIAFPTKEKNEFYVFEENDEITTNLGKYHMPGGKWMMFVDFESLDTVWSKACKLYREKELTGIHSLKASTAKPSLKATGPKEEVIIFHCGPADDKALMLSYGRNVAEKMQYTSKSGYMAYKSDEQSALGTRASGCNINYRYRVPVPKPPGHIERSYYVDKELTEWSRGKELNPPQPSKVTSSCWLDEMDSDIRRLYGCDRSVSGYWLTFHEKSQLDDAWRKACELYRGRQLYGISAIRVSTAKMIDLNSKNQRNGNTGHIMFFCGPNHDLELVRTYGRNIIALLKYSDPNGSLSYRSSGVTLCKIKTERRSVRDWRD